MTHPKFWSAMACSAVLISGCAGDTDDQPESTAVMDGEAAAENSTWVISKGTQQTLEVSDADLELMKAFVSFAVEPSEETAGQVPFADDGVRLGLGDELTQSVDVAGIADVESWTIKQDSFRGYTGPFSPLSAIQEHVGATGADDPMRKSGDLQVSVGDHPRCASPSAPVPAGLESMRQISVQPSDDSITTCIVWFSVDLFVTPDGDVQAVTLDLFEP